MLKSDILKTLFGGEQRKAQNVIHITELIRTFQIHELEELAAKSGGAVRYCWVNKIKSEAYVVYEAAESATAAFKAMNGLQWPRSSTKRLQVAFGTEDEFRKVVREDAQRGGNPIAAELWKKLFPGEELVVNPPLCEGAQKRASETKDSLEPLRKLFRSDNKLSESKEDKKEDEPEDDNQDPPLQKIPVDELFMKTKAEPHIYYLPLIIENEEEKEESKENESKIGIDEDVSTECTNMNESNKDLSNSRNEDNAEEKDITNQIDEAAVDEDSVI